MPGANADIDPRDPVSLARTAPVDLGIVADIKLATADLIDAVNSLATRRASSRSPRSALARVREYSAQRTKLIPADRARSRGGSAIRIGTARVELERALERTRSTSATLISGKNMDRSCHLEAATSSMSAPARTCSVGAWLQGSGARLAAPDRPVVSVVGDGSFLFSGPQPLWSLARYQVPNTVHRAQITRATTMSAIASG